MADSSDLAARIRASGGRMTAARRAVIAEIVAAGGHVTAEDLTERVQSALPRVDRSTIYRNLSALEEAGVVYHVHLAHGPSVYHLADADELHAHAVCEHCGAVVELPAHALRELTAELLTDNGFQLGRQHFALTGRCRRCSPRPLGVTRGHGR